MKKEETELTDFQVFLLRPNESLKAYDYIDNFYLQVQG